jgi:hypothetical protein
VSHRALANSSRMRLKDESHSTRATPISIDKRGCRFQEPSADFNCLDTNSSSKPNQSAKRTTSQASAVTQSVSGKHSSIHLSIHPSGLLLAHPGVIALKSPHAGLVLAKKTRLRAGTAQTAATRYAEKSRRKQETDNIVRALLLEAHCGNVDGVVTKRSPAVPEKTLEINVVAQEQEAAATKWAVAALRQPWRQE